MKVILFGATGMVGQGTLLECLDDPGVERVLAVVRRPTGRSHPKLVELVHQDFSDYSAAESQLQGYDACFFCLGVSAAGLSEAEYTKITYDYTLAAARTLARLNPQLVFCYVSGQGTDSTGKSWQMWARVKGRTENDLLALPLGGAYMFRPGFIQPVRGVVSSTGWYRVMYAIIGPLYPLLSRLFPRALVTSAELGQALLRTARQAAPKKILAAADIAALARGVA
jgi:uncharacterized protein YbjT (DUF2867 family)